MVCESWCNEWTCNKPNHCGTCDKCIEAKKLAADAKKQSIAGCQSWCSEWTCNQPNECGRCEACMPNPPPPPLLPNAFHSNPFVSPSGWYVNPTLSDRLEATIAHATHNEIQVLQQMVEVPSAFWIDNKGKLRGRGRLDTLEGILEDAASRPEPPLCVFIFYDLPNRDCSAAASAGEISFDEGAADEALREYKKEYVDSFVQVLSAFPKVPVVLILEPDSLGNIISNQAAVAHRLSGLARPLTPLRRFQGRDHCSAETVRNYKLGVKYAVEQLSRHVPHAGLYIDAAHGGWMGFEPNAAAFVSLMKQMDVIHKIRGFSTNVANYQPLGLDSLCPPEGFDDAGRQVRGATGGVAEWCKDQGKGSACCSTDPCKLFSLGSGGTTESNYVQTLRRHFIRETGWAPYFVIDTGRNGAATEPRRSCKSWCNVRGAGAGAAATLNTRLPGVVDAFFWLKTPGESDGCTRTLESGATCVHFDPMCASADAIGSAEGDPRAPEAGEWFDYQVRMLARNADLRLDEDGALDSMWGVSGVPRRPARLPPRPKPQPPPSPLDLPPPSLAVSSSSSRLDPSHTTTALSPSTAFAMLQYAPPPLPELFFAPLSDSVYQTPPDSFMMQGQSGSSVGSLPLPVVASAALLLAIAMPLSIRACRRFTEVRGDSRMAGKHSARGERSPILGETPRQARPPSRTTSRNRQAEHAGPGGKRKQSSRPAQRSAERVCRVV